MNLKQQHLEPSLSSLKEEIESLHVVIDELFKRFVEAERAAAFDDLTGLLRRNHFFAKTESMIKDNRVSCLLLFDIDHFKSINDRFGHPSGDEVLKEFSKILRSVVGDVGLIGRLGGEEFAVALPCDEEESLELAEKIRAAVDAAVFLASSQALHVTVSVGMTKITTLNVSYSDADQKLYLAKTNGRNKICA